MISFELNEEIRLVQETVRAFAAEKIRPAHRSCERAGAVDPALWEEFRSLGLNALTLPAEVGGAELGAIALAVTAEELAWGDPGVAAALLCDVPATTVIAELGTEEQRARLLTPIAEGAARAALALSEVDPPADGVGTSATKEEGGYRLEGRKSFVANGATAELHLILAQTDAGPGWEHVRVFAAEAATGLAAGTLHETLGLRALPFREVVLDGCVVPQENVLGDADTGRSLGRALQRASLLPAALAVGCARAAYEYALRYAEERQAFGRPIGHFQAIAFMLSDMAMDVEAARWMVWRAAAALDHGQFDAAALAMATTHAFEAAARVTDHGVQILGGHGYMDDHPVEKWMRDARTLSLYLSTPDLADAQLQDAVLGEEPAAAQMLPISGLQPVLT